jgi:hypothetical protein
VRSQRPDGLDRRVGAPALVRVHRDRVARAHHLAGDAHAALVVGRIGPDLELHHREALLPRLVQQPGELLVAVAEPAGGGGVGGDAALAQGVDPLLLALGAAAQDREGLLAAERVLEIAQVHQVQQFLGGQRGEGEPQRAALAPSAQVPQRVADRADRHGHHALLGAEPAQLRVVGETAVQTAEVAQDLLDVTAQQVRGEGGDRGALHVVAAADGEHERGPGVPGVGAHGEIRGRVVGVGVHRVRAREVAAGGEADVLDVQGGEGAHRRRRLLGRTGACRALPRRCEREVRARRGVGAGSARRE